MINKICIIAPKPQSLHQRLEDCTQGIIINCFECNINQRKEALTAVGFLENQKPDYALIGLDEFEIANCIPIVELSLYLEKRKIPAHFLLAEALNISNLTVQEWSFLTGIRDLWSCPLEGEEFFKYIKAQASIYRTPTLTRSAVASTSKGPDNDFGSPYVM
ncbi:MAG TPA: hypothetical protein PKD79_01990 [Candidatus Doudnabacteria bacterium]|nr:hypothetical protein [Candidatus Doudnabacteria bacterium]